MVSTMTEEKGTRMTDDNDRAERPKTWHPKLLDDRGLKFESVRIEDINVDASYQRPLSRAKIDQMWEKFDPAEMTAIVVSRRADGSLWALDGQHRLELLSRLGKAVVLADVREGLTVEQEAHLFYRLNTGQTRVGSWDTFRARLRAREPIAVRINEIVERHGFHLGRDIENGGISATSALERAFDMGRLDKTLSIISTVWPNDRVSLEASIILGIAVFLASSDSDPVYEDEQLLASLDKIPASGILRRAKELALETGRANQRGSMVGYAVRDAYNGLLVRGSRPKKQLYAAIVARSVTNRTVLRRG
jgi:hypothetical protein